MNDYWRAFLDGFFSFAVICLVVNTIEERWKEWKEKQMPNDHELMSLELIAWIEKHGNQNGHLTYRLTASEITMLLAAARAAHELKAKIDGINERYGMAIKQCDIAIAAWMQKWGQEREENEKLREELKQEQAKRHEMAKRLKN